MAILLFATSTVWAGRYLPVPVEVDFDERVASGDMLTAANDNQNKDVFIGCGTRNIDDGVGGIFSFAFCQAQDAEGDVVTCSTQNPALVEAVRAISDFSFIIFRWSVDELENVTCRSIGVSTQSWYLDKVKPSSTDGG